MTPRSKLVLVLLVFLAAGLRLRYFTGLQVGDDIVYSTIAAQRVQGLWQVTNVHEARWGFMLPLTLSYALFGPGEVPLVLYNLLCSLGLVVVVYFLARRFWGETAAAIAGALTAIHPTLVFFATECHTDTPAALWQALAVLVYLAAEQETGRGKRVLAGILVGWAWLHKEHAVFILPFFALRWLHTKRPWTWYLPMALPALGIVLAEMAADAALTGNPFERIALVRSMHVGHYMANEYPTTSAMLRRVFLDLPMLLFTLRNGHHWEGTLNVAAVLGGVWLLRSRSAGAGTLAGWWAAIFAGYCAWPSSLIPYLPSFFLFEWTLPPLLGPLMALLGGAAARIPRPAAAAGLLILSGLSLFTMQRSWENGLQFAAGGKELHAWLLREKPSHLITDDKTLEVLGVLDGHRDVRRQSAFKDREDFDGTVVAVDKFWTRPGQWWSRPITNEALNPPPTWRKVYESDRLVIYRP